MIFSIFWKHISLSAWKHPGEDFHSNNRSAFVRSSKPTRHLFIHLSIHPSTEAASPCPLAQDRPSLQGTVAGFVPISCLTFSRPALVPSHACTVGKRASVHPSRQPVRRPPIHSFTERLTSCTTPAQNKASLWGTVVDFVPPPHASHSPDLPWDPPRGTEHWKGRHSGLLTPPFPFSLSDIITFIDPTPHKPTPAPLSLSETCLSPAFNGISCTSFIYCPLGQKKRSITWSNAFVLTILRMYIYYESGECSTRGRQEVYFNPFCFFSLTIFWTPVCNYLYQLVQKEHNPPTPLYSYSLHLKHKKLIQRQWLSVLTAHFYSSRRRVGA